MSAWHVDDGVAAAYGERRLDPVQRASVEAHAVRCKECRSVLGAGATGPTNSQRSPDLDLEHLWARVEAAVSTPEVGRSGRALLRLGVSMSDVVVTRVVAAQSRQWTMATTLVLAVTAVAAVLGPVDSAHAAFLVVAPLLPALGVAATYRLVPHGIDLLERAAPFSPARMANSPRRSPPPARSVNAAYAGKRMTPIASRKRISALIWAGTAAMRSASTALSSAGRRSRCRWPWRKR